MALRVKRGMSTSSDPVQAAEEFCAQVAQDDPTLVLFFCSSQYDLERLGAEIRRRLPGPVYGCTTAGEITPEGYRVGALVGASLSSDRTRLIPLVIPEVHSFDATRAMEVGDRMRAGIRAAQASLPRSGCFGIFLMDGVSVMEEQVIGHLYRVLDGTPIVGGSAGDDLAFKATHVYADGRFMTDVAVLLAVVTEHKFRVFKSQHFQPSTERLVITRADANRRIVYEINGEPAAWEYARIIGLDVKQLEPMIFSKYPLMLRIGGEYFVRSIRNVNEDGSLTLFCAIDEGLVLTLSRGVDMVEDTAALFAQVKSEIPDPALVLGFECVLRRLEIEEKRLAGAGELMKRHCVVGFHTYGEQLNAVHINQTLTGVAIGD